MFYLYFIDIVYSYMTLLNINRLYNTFGWCDSLPVVVLAWFFSSFSFFGNCVVWSNKNGRTCQKTRQGAPNVALYPVSLFSWYFGYLYKVRDIRCILRKSSISIALEIIMKYDYNDKERQTVRGHINVSCYFGCITSDIFAQLNK